MSSDKVLERCLRSAWPRPRTHLRRPSICLATFIFFVCCSNTQVWRVEGLGIDNMAIPEPIINGSTPAIILDCEYHYEKNDTQSLVVQWYYNFSNTPIYQWIPPKGPEALGEFQTRLDLQHKVSDDPYTQHRALRILRPTVELSGNYKCLVSSFHSEDHKNKNLVVYVPAERLEINVTKPGDGSVNVSCISEGGYPEPLISLVLYRNDNEKAEAVDNFQVFARDGDGNGRNDVIGYKVFEDRHLANKITFECVLAIADADYKETEQHVYYPGLPSTPRPLSHTNSQVLLTAFISTESSLVDIQHISGSVGLLGPVGWSSRLLTLTSAVSIIIFQTFAAFMFLGSANGFRS